MAITLDELLGMNTSKTQSDRRVDSFPSYDDFSSRDRNSQPIDERQGSAYSFDYRPATPPRSEEYMRNYERTRSYEIPRATEYQTREYDVYDVARRRSVEPPAQGEDRAYGYTHYQTYANPSYQTQERRNSLYEFTRNDNDRLSDAELDAKLGGTSFAGSSSAMRPISRPENARLEESIAERQSIFTPVKSSFKSESAKKARLNTKGKILLAVYLAVMVLVAVLIIVNAGSLNSGTATTPSSSVGSVATEVGQSNIQSSYAINFEYGDGFQIR